MRKLPVLISFCLLLGMSAKAQDQQFSQFFAAPLTLNPALSGAFSGTYRVGLIYRSQFQQQLESPMVTYAAAADFRFKFNRTGKKRQDHIGAGMLFYADRFGNTGFSTNQMAVSAAYHKSLSNYNDQYLSFGAHIGIAQRNVNFENIFFQDQFNGTTGFTDPTGELFPENNFTFSDFAVGLNYSVTGSRGLALYAGGALHHILEPQVTFYQNAEIPEDNGDNRLHRKYTGYVAGQIPLNSSIQLHPRAMILAQGPHMSINAGSNIRFLVNELSGVAIHVGAWARPVRDQEQPFVMDAVVAMAGFEFNNILLGFSYDIGMSYLELGNPNNRSVFEITLAYLGNYDNSSVLCPKF